MRTKIMNNIQPYVILLSCEYRVFHYVITPLSNTFLYFKHMKQCMVPRN